MNIQNYFVKLILIPMNDGDHLPLFGFCVPTSQEPMPWHTLSGDKQEKCVWRAMLRSKELDAFLDSATRPGIIRLNDTCSFSSPLWIKRPTVLTNDGQQRQPGPVSGFMLLDEYWKMHKAQMARLLESTLTNCPKAKSLFGDTTGILAWAKEVCGIDFVKSGVQFGNFNHFRFPALAEEFEVEIDKLSNLLWTTVSKKAHISQRLIVNCVAEHRGRTICNQTKMFPPDEDHIEFFSVEPMSHVTVQIWDTESGDLVFSKDITLILNVNIDMAVKSIPLIVQDPWTTGIKNAASNRSEQVKREIETVYRTAHERQMSVCSDARSDFDTAFQEGSKLFKGFAQGECRGAFVPVKHKDGEIDAFLRLRSYLDDPAVRAATIVDPYFSVEATTKLLTRIQNSVLKLDVITSLSTGKPKKGKKVNEADHFKIFLDANASLLHKSLRILNLTRGTGSAFHDRYLLRRFADGHTDGFLLSNSINSMGAHDPFVIVPMEQVVLESVQDYLRKLLDPTYQKRFRKDSRVNCETFFDNANYARTSSIEIAPEAQPWHSWFPQWQNSNGELHIPKEEISIAVDAVWTHWSSEPEASCKALCQLASDAPEEVTKALKRIVGAPEKFARQYINLANVAESRQNHQKRAVDDPVSQLWALLNDSAEPSIEGFHLWFREAGHVYYRTDTWLYGGYKLLLSLDPAEYTRLMNELKSPMAFDRLAFRLLFCPWSQELYKTILSAQGILPQWLCAEWMFMQTENNALSNVEIEAVLSALPQDLRVTQSAYLISRVTFHRRVSMSAADDPARWRSLYELLLKIIAEELSDCDSKTLDTVSVWLTDSKVESHSQLLMDLVTRTECVPIRERFLKQIIEIAEKTLRNHPVPVDMPELTDLLLQACDALYGTKAESKLCKAIASRDDMERATEPALQDYNHKLWHRSHLRAVRQMALMRVFLKRHPEAGPNELLRDWEARIDLM